MSSQHLPSGWGRPIMTMPPPPARPAGKLTFVDFPLEVQQQIVKHMMFRDLFVFQRLSSHCFFLANAQLYRNLDLSLASAGDEEGGWSSRVADALQMILASDYDYAQHIKSFRLGFVGDASEVPTGHSHRPDSLLMTKLLWDSKSDASKLLNTTILLVMRRASKMETFQWDAPIEMSGAVYQALHKMESLKHLRVRLDVSSPKLVLRHGLPPTHALPPPLPTLPGTTTSTPYLPPPPPLGLGLNPAISTAQKVNNIKRKKAGGNGGCNYWANPRPFSGFRTLSTLALVGMSNLDCLPEIAECIKASSATLKVLTVTLSADLARKAQKPPAVNPEVDDPSDTELEDDEVLNDLPDMPTGATQAPPVNEADIRKERMAQESILARIFDLQSVVAEGKKIEKNLSQPLPQILPEQDNGAITRKVNELMKSLLNTSGASDADVSSDTTRLNQFKMIREVADLYITGQDKQKKMLKDYQKAPAPTPKQSGAPSKPLNPLATDFKQAQSPMKQFKFEVPAHSSGPAFNCLVNKTPKSHVLGCSSSENDAQSLALPNNGVGNTNNIEADPDSIASSNANVQQALQKMMYAQQQPQSLTQIPVEILSQASQASLPPYPGAAPYPHIPIPSESHPPYPLSPGNDPGVFGTVGMYPPCPPSLHDESVSSNGMSLWSPNGVVSPTQSGASNGSIKAKGKTPNVTNAGPVEDSNHDLENNLDTESQVPPSTSQPVFTAEPFSVPPEDAMDVDMEHPDEDIQELGEDQETVTEGEDNDMQIPRKRTKFESLGANDATIARQDLPIKPEPIPALEAITTDEEMRAYIRTSHGLGLESFSIERVPLKASVVGRALDLSVLKRVTLLEVGTQDSFWMLLVRLQKASPEISFTSIQTDNVSLPFVRFLTTFEGLEELFMHERSNKQGDDTMTNPKVDIMVIRKLGLQKHARTLKRLMIRNERNDLWDLDAKTLHFLAKKCTELIELAVSMNMKTYHFLMQYFATFKKLYALHLISLRINDRSMTLQSESLNFAVDSLAHCPNTKIKYIAIVNSVMSLETKPEQWRKHMKIEMERRKDKKGKGKATPDAVSSLLEQCDDSGSDEVEELISTYVTGNSKFRMPTSFAAVDDVKVFSKQIRTGKL